MVREGNSEENNPCSIPGLMDFHRTSRNYEIVHLNEDDDRCFVFFSGNGLYQPNDPATFRRVVVENNRFEWKRNIPQSANKAIFLRDVTKQHYFEGINGTIDTIGKLRSFLEEQTRGLQVICVGSSMGGYAATLFGCLLRASRVFSFAGSFSLRALLQSPRERASNPVLLKYEHDEDYKDYFLLCGLLKSTRTPVFYFYPGRCGFDITQSRFIEDIPSVYPFRFTTRLHPATCLEINFPDLFSRDTEDLVRLQRRYHNTLISPLAFSFRTSGISRSLGFAGRRLVKKGVTSVFPRRQG